MKKIFKMMFVLALLLVQLVPATLVNAVSGTNKNNGKITINNVSEDKTYAIYQILQLESYNTDTNSYSYKVVSDTWKTFLNGVGSAYVEVNEQDYVTWKSGADEIAFSKLALKYAKENNIPATKTITANVETIKNDSGVDYIEFTDLNLGYYLVDSSLGTLCGLTTTKPNASVNEKNTMPTVNKEVKEDSTGEYANSNTAQIGQEVEFKTTITIGEGAINYVLYDKMSEGLSYVPNSIVVNKVASDGTERLVPDTNYTVTTPSEYTFVITFNNTYIATLSDTDKLVVTYKAILNDKAVVEGNGNPNETFLKYGDDPNHTTDTDTTLTYTYDFEIVKTKTDYKILTGAEFALYTSATGGSAIPLIALTDEGDYKVYRVATTEEVSAPEFKSAVIQAGKVIIRGLDKDTYYLEETKAPEGYNKLPARVDFTVTGTSSDDLLVTDEVYQTNHGLVVVNKTGAELPSTGGIGTMLFILIGSVMVIGFGILLVTKLRMAKIED